MIRPFLWKTGPKGPKRKIFKK